MPLKNDLVDILKSNKDYTDSVSGVSVDFGNNLRYGSDKKPYFNDYDEINGDFGVIIFNVNGVDKELNLTSLAEFESLFGSRSIIVADTVIERVNVREYFFGHSFFGETLGSDFLKDCINLRILSNLPVNLEKISNSFLRNCINFNFYFGLELTSVKSIGNDFLSGCSSFNSILNFPSSLTSIANNFMSGCTSFNKQIGFNSYPVEVIVGDNFLMNCTGLNGSFSVPNNISFTGANVFYNLYNINKLYLDCSPDNAGLDSLVVDKNNVPAYTQGVIICGIQAEKWKSKFHDIIDPPLYRYLKVCDEVLNYVSIEYYGSGSKPQTAYIVDHIQVDSLYGTDPNRNLSTNQGDIPVNKVKSVTFGSLWAEKYDSILDNFMAFSTIEGVFNIPDELLSIGNSFLSNCAKLKDKLVLPINLKSIGNNFLNECGQFNQQLVIPYSLKTIINPIMKNCDNFKNIVVWYSNPTITGDNTESFSTTTWGAPIQGNIYFCGTYSEENRSKFPPRSDPNNPPFRDIKSCNGYPAYAEVEFSSPKFPTTQKGYIVDLNEFNNLSVIGSNISLDVEKNIPRENILKVTVTHLISNQTLPDNFCNGLINLEELDISYNRIKVFGDRFCYNCYNLTDLNYSNISISVIGNYFLYNCRSLNTQLTINPGIIRIGYYFCFNCYNMTKIYFNDVPLLPIANKTILSADKADSSMISKGLEVCGTRYEKIIALLPNNTIAPYRNLYKCNKQPDPPLNAWAIIEYNQGGYKYLTISSEEQFETLYGNGDILTDDGPIVRDIVTGINFGSLFVYPTNSYTISSDFCINLPNLVDIQHFPIHRITQIYDNFFSNCPKLEHFDKLEFTPSLFYIGKNFFYNCRKISFNVRFLDDVIYNLEGFMSECRSMQDTISVETDQYLGGKNNVLVVKDSNSLAFKNGIRVVGDYAGGFTSAYPNINDTSNNNYRNLIDYLVPKGYASIDWNDNGTIKTNTLSNLILLLTLFNASSIVSTDQGSVDISKIVKVTLSGLENLSLNGLMTLNGFCNNYPNLEVVDVSRCGLIYNLGHDFLKNCPKLTKLFMEPGLLAVGKSFLEGCTRFNWEIDLNNLVLVDSFFLKYCDSFNKEIKLNPYLTRLNDSFLQGLNIWNYNIDLTNIEIINSYLLMDCVSFNKSLSFHDELESIGSFFLSGCSSFNQNLIFPGSLKSIDGGFLSKCSSFNSTLNFNSAKNTLESIGSGFLENCTSYNKPLDLSMLTKIKDWGTNDERKNFTTGILGYCESFNSNLKLPPNIKKCFNTLRGCKTFNQDIEFPKDYNHMNGLSDVYGLYNMANCRNFTKTLTWNTSFKPSSITWITLVDRTASSTTSKTDPIATEGYTVEGSHADIIKALPDDPGENVFRHIKNR